MPGSFSLDEGRMLCLLLLRYTDELFQVASLTSWLQLLEEAMPLTEPTPIPKSFGGNSFEFEID